jgi:HPt (histidine-containing phosphotransfer) domain-containing protein
MSDDEVLDRVAFDDFAGLFERGELRGVIEEWHANSQKALAAIADARARGDAAQIGELAHRAAGGAMAIGATALARAAERLRAVAESGGSVGDDAIAPVREAVTATYAAMTAAVNEPG